MHDESQPPRTPAQMFPDNVFEKIFLNWFFMKQLRLSLGKNLAIPSILPFHMAVVPSYFITFLKQSTAPVYGALRDPAAISSLVVWIRDLASSRGVRAERIAAKDSVDETLYICIFLINFDLFFMQKRIITEIFYPLICQILSKLTLAKNGYEF